MRILLTGVCGFICSHLADRLLREGCKIFAIDNMDTGSIWNIQHLLDNKNFKFIKRDILDREIIDSLVKQVDIVVHLAAQVSVDRSYIEPELTWDINVKGTQNILESAKWYDKRVIYASSSEVYGSAQNGPMCEKHQLCPSHPYGASKLAADRLCYAYKETYGMDISILRFFNIFGPRQRDAGYGGAIALFLKRLLRKLPPIIYGSGEQSRDYLFIEDAIEAYLMFILTGSNYETPINIGTGIDVSINDIAIKYLPSALGLKIKPVYTSPRPSEVNRLIADISKIKGYGWEPKVSFEQGIHKLVEWYSKYARFN